MKSVIVLVASVTILAMSQSPAVGADYYVDPNGSDDNPGTFDAPFASPDKAVTLPGLTAGDTIYLRGGVYALNEQVILRTRGLKGKPIRLWAYRGELPVLDFKNMPEDEPALYLRADYWHIRGIEVRNAPSFGIFVNCRGSIIEGCVIHGCGADGLTLYQARETLVLNCDSYHNDRGGNRDHTGSGFMVMRESGEGNRFEDCRAWGNAFHGWNLFDCDQGVAVVNCLAVNNGYDSSGKESGLEDGGSGFRFGRRQSAGRHVLTHCVAAGNRQNGFDQGAATIGQTLVNCTGYDNKVNFSFPTAPVSGQNRLINNLAFKGTAMNLDPTAIQVCNSWQLVSVSADDFVSLDISKALLPRNPDYTLPTSDFLRLAENSGLIDRGTIIKMPFHGDAPDLGAFESQHVMALPGTKLDQ